jgi:hypothetical protein
MTHRIVWTPRQDKVLAECWPNPEIQTRNLARRLGRSVSAVWLRALQLNLGPRPRLGPVRAKDGGAL